MVISLIAIGLLNGGINTHKLMLLFRMFTRILPRRLQKKVVYRPFLVQSQNLLNLSLLLISFLLQKKRRLLMISYLLIINLLPHPLRQKKRRRKKALLRMI
jgi:hypothetical protein